MSLGMRRQHDAEMQRSEYLRASFAPGAGDESKDPAVTYRKRQDLLQQLIESPAVASATYTTRLPAADQETTYVEFEGTTAPVRVAHIGPDSFETFKRPLVAGRQFTSRELESGANVAVVDESFLRFLLRGRSAVGLRVREAPARAGEDAGPWIEIIPRNPHSHRARRIAAAHRHRHPLESLGADRRRRGGWHAAGVAIVSYAAADAGGNGLTDGIVVAAAVALFVLSIAGAACSVPLRRALRVEPTEALRVT
jgi:hypothetical protein